MPVITVKQIKEASAGQQVSGVVLIKDYGKKMTKTNKPYIDGTIQSGDTIGFKIWSGALCDSFISEDYSNCICQFTGKIDEYQGTKSVVLESCVAVDGYSESQFLEVVYEKNAYFKAFCDNVRAGVSDKGWKLFEELFLSNTELVERFKIEFAAKSHHDNVLSGLLVHSYKVVQLMHVVMNMYPAVAFEEGKPSQDRKDLLILGTALHDIGKTQEMELGVYQPNSAISHRFFGAELLVEHKKSIIDSYGVKWYYDFCSIMLEHHGEWGDPCRTLPALLVNMVDEFDAKATGITQDIARGNVSETKSGTSVWVDGKAITL